MAGSAGEWVDFGNRQSGQLEKANTDKGTIHQVITGCEKRDQLITQGLQKKWYQFWK